MIFRNQYVLMNEENGGEGSGGGASDSGANYSGSDFDIEAASADLARDLFGAEPEDRDDDDQIDRAADEAQNADKEPEAADKQEAAPPVPTGKAPPASWAKEKHEAWSKLTPDVQEYIEIRENQMREGVKAVAKDAEYGKALAQVIAPYKPLIQSQGLDDAKAVQYLLNAHHVLTNAPPEQRTAYALRVMQSYGVDLALPGKDGAQSPQRQVDPVVRQLQHELNQIKGHLTQGQQAAFEARSRQVESEVSSFASDEAHPYFDECADEIVAHINAGLSLQDAYDRAVWANPVTRAKEIARQTAEAEAKFKARAKDQGQAARTTRKTNLSGRDTQRTPTAKTGTIDDVMRETYENILARQSH